MSQEQPTPPAITFVLAMTREYKKLMGDPPERFTLPLDLFERVWYELLKLQGRLPPQGAPVPIPELPPDMLINGQTFIPDKDSGNRIVLANSVPK